MEMIPLIQKIEIENDDQPGRCVRLKPSAYDQAINLLTNFYAPKQNVSVERLEFRRLKQEENESIGMFEIRLRTHAERCEFSDQLDSNIRDQITQTCRSDLIRRKILERTEASLDDIMKMARSIEAASSQQKIFNNNSSSSTTNDVCKINVKQKYKNESKNFSIECNRCGKRGHKALDPNCPAKGKVCSKCNGKNHFARKCYTREGKFAKNISNKRSDTKDNDEVDDSNKKMKIEKFKRLMLMKQMKKLKYFVSLLKNQRIILLVKLEVL